jgi:predicted transcriptional regulator
MPDPLKDLRAAADEAIARAHEALAQKRELERQVQREQQRQAKIDEYMALIRQGLNATHEKILTNLEELVDLGTDHPAYQLLKVQLQEIEQQLAHPEVLAEKAYEEEIWEQDVAEDNRKIEEQINSWRRELQQDLSQSIDEADEYFAACDLAVYVRDYKEDLLAIGAFEAVVEHLVRRVNQLDSVGKPKEIRGSHSRTLDWMADFAQEQRYPRQLLGSDGSLIKVRQSSRRQAERPYSYSDLTGKVVVFGGHPHMREGVLKRLGNSQVNLIWIDMEQSDTQAKERAEVVKGADVVILVISYCSHKFQTLAKAACDRHGLELTYCNQTGASSLIDLMVQKLSGNQAMPDDMIEAFKSKFGRKPQR